MRAALALPVGAIVAIAVAGVLLVFVCPLIIFIVCCCCMKKKEKQGDRGEIPVAVDARSAAVGNTSSANARARGAPDPAPLPRAANEAKV